MGGSQLPTGSINCLFPSHPSSLLPTPSQPHQATPNNLPSLAGSMFLKKKDWGDSSQWSGDLLLVFSNQGRRLNPETAAVWVPVWKGCSGQTYWHVLLRVKWKDSRNEKQKRLDFAFPLAIVVCDPFASVPHIRVLLFPQSKWEIASNPKKPMFLITEEHLFL